MGLAASTLFSFTGLKSRLAPTHPYTAMVTTSCVSVSIAFLVLLVIMQ